VDGFRVTKTGLFGERTLLDGKGHKEVWFVRSTTRPLLCLQAPAARLEMAGLRYGCIFFIFTQDIAWNGNSIMSDNCPRTGAALLLARLMSSPMVPPHID